MRPQTGTQSQRGRRVQKKKQAQSLRTFYIVLGAAAIVGAAFLISFAVGGGFNPASPPAEVAPVNYEVGTTPEGFYYKGSPDAPVKVIEYSDFQCPACATFNRVLAPEITRNYIQTGQVQLIYHDFPLSFHSNAVKASEAARCAGEQGAFWQMHDLIYVNQNQWAPLTSPTNRFAAYAEQVGLNRSEFLSCLNSGRYTAAVTQAGQTATQIGIPATPSFVVNGGQPIDQGQLRAAIEAALAAQGQ